MDNKGIVFKNGKEALVCNLDDRLAVDVVEEFSSAHLGDIS
jgi:hypothetical protein